MRNVILWSAIFAGMLSSPSIAQMTPIDPSQWSLPNVMVEGMRNGRRDHSRATSRREIEAGARRTCARLPVFAARLGARDPRIVQLSAMCRKAGYR